MQKTMFDIIKKQNGEAFAKAIRNYDNGILDIPNLDKIVKYAGRKAEPIMEYLISLKNIKIIEKINHEDPIALLSIAGYDAYVVNSLEEQNAIKKYFKRGEELCTFNDAQRFKNYYIINAVHKDVENIKREDFVHPQREDKYGTSVISIQVLKTGGFISIKNRYNHSVENPDNTFNSEPDRIIPGLADAIKYHFNVDFSSRKISLPDDYILLDGKIVKFNYEKNNIYIGDGFYVCNGKIVEINKDSELLFDTILFDFKTKSFREVGQSSGENSYLVSLFNSVVKNNSVSVRKNVDGTHSFFVGGMPIATLENGTIVALTLPGIREITEVPKNFGKFVRYLSLPDTEILPNNFFTVNLVLAELNAPRLKRIKKNCFNITAIKELKLPELEELGDNCFFAGSDIELINAPKLKIMGANCFKGAVKLKSLDLPKLEKMNANCFLYNTGISSLNLPTIQKIGYNCFEYNRALKNVELPRLEDLGANCFLYNADISSLKLPALKYMRDNCFANNTKLKMLDLPSLEEMWSGCFRYNDGLLILEAPKLRDMLPYCFEHNTRLKLLNLPKAEKIGLNCFKDNKLLSSRLEPLMNSDCSVAAGTGVYLNLFYQNAAENLDKAKNLKYQKVK